MKRKLSETQLAQYSYVFWDAVNKLPEIIIIGLFFTELYLLAVTYQSQLQSTRDR